MTPTNQNLDGSGKLAVINADDLGFSPGVTEGIFRAHREGIVTSTTLAANMPHAAEAVGQAGDYPDLGVGVHLNISQGPALSEAGRRKLAGPDGQMNRTAMQVVGAVASRPWLLKAVTAEFDAQIRRALELGLRPTHLDSHRHSHGFPPIFNCVAALARRYAIPFVRRLGEHLPGRRRDWPAAPAKQRRNSRVLNVFGAVNARRHPGLCRCSGTWGVQHTGYIDADWLIRVADRLPVGATEIMVHPGSGDDLDGGLTRLRQCRQVELAALCDPAVAEAFDRAGIERTHYGRL